MPVNMVMASTAIRPSVRVAVCASGALKAGTPSETASTPVMAVQPLANADSSTNRVIDPAPRVGSGSVVTTGTAVPASTW
jgi:hypothetical protein